MEPPLTPLTLEKLFLEMEILLEVQILTETSSTEEETLQMLQ